MKLTIYSILLAFLAVFASAAQPSKQVIISFPKGTPGNVLENVKTAILEAGGYISHEYTLIMAVAATVPATILDAIKAAGAEHNILIEQDSEVSINNV